MAEEKDILKEITSQEYEHGFVTDVEQEFIPKGLDEDIIRLISAKKDEPQWLLDFRLDAFRKWKKMKRRRKFLQDLRIQALLFLQPSLMSLRN